MFTSNISLLADVLKERLRFLRRSLEISNSQVLIFMFQSTRSATLAGFYANILAATNLIVLDFSIAGVLF